MREVFAEPPECLPRAVKRPARSHGPSARRCRSRQNHEKRRTGKWLKRQSRSRSYHLKPSGLPGPCARRPWPPICFSCPSWRCSPCFLSCPSSMPSIKACSAPSAVAWDWERRPSASTGWATTWMWCMTPTSIAVWGACCSTASCKSRSCSSSPWCWPCCWTRRWCASKPSSAWPSLCPLPSPASSPRCCGPFSTNPSSAPSSRASRPWACRPPISWGRARCCGRSPTSPPGPTPATTCSSSSPPCKPSPARSTSRRASTAVRAGGWPGASKSRWWPRPSS